MTLRDEAKMSFGITWYFSLAVVLLFAAITAAMVMKPTWLGFEREAFKSSHQYIEAKQSMLLKLAEEYSAAETEIAQYQAAQSADEGKNYGDVIEGLQNQQAAILSRMRRESELIPENEVPRSVRKLIE